MSAEEIEARDYLEFGGMGRERIVEEEEADCLVESVASSRAGDGPGVEEGEGMGDVAGRGERPPRGMIMVKPTAEEVRRWEGLWRPIAFACRREAWVGGVAPRVLCQWQWVHLGARSEGGLCRRETGRMIEAGAEAVADLVPSAGSSGADEIGGGVEAGAGDISRRFETLKGLPPY